MENNTFFISGELNFDGVMGLYKDACFKIDNSNNSKIIFDFSNVSQTNSAGLALILELINYANKKNKTIQFLHLSANLVSAAKISNVDELLHESA